MSITFPSVPGFTGPLSLKAFFEAFFNLKLTFGPSAPTSSQPPLPSDSGGQPNSCFLSSTNGLSTSPARESATEVVLPHNASFLVVMYVAKHAPSPPPPQASQGPSSNPHYCDPFVPRATPRTDAWSASHTRPHRLPRNTGSRVGDGVGAPSSRWCMYTDTRLRPCTHALLRHPWWSSLADCLGPAAMGFVEMYCPVVLQLEAMAGGVQVLGPPLKQAVVGCGRASADTKKVCAIKRSRDEDNVNVGRRGKRKREVSSRTERAEKRQRSQWSDELHTTTSTTRPADAVNVSVGGEAAAKVPKSSAPTNALTSRKRMKADTWEGMLPRTDVPRTRLYSAESSDRAAWCGAQCGRSAKEGDHEGVVEAPSANLLESLWLSRHPRTLSCVMRASMPRWLALCGERVSAANAAGQKDKTAPRSAPLQLPDDYVRHVFRWMTLPPTSSGDAARSGSFDITAHLHSVLTQVLNQCSRLDLRGAALKHLHFLEVRFQRQQQAPELADLQQLQAPCDVVVAYLRTLLSSLQWETVAPAKTGNTRSSFWGLTDEASTRVLDALLTAVQAWLSTSRHAGFPVSRFLNGVPVAEVPWLSGFFTVPTSPSPAASRHARLQRSQVQQRVWQQFVLFLTQDIIPFLLRASFAVTWSAKNPNRLLFFPASVWHRVVRGELRRTVGPPSCGRDNADDAGVHEDKAKEEEERRVELATVLPRRRKKESRAVKGRMQPIALSSREASLAELDQRGAAAVLRTRPNAPSLLYAGVRFRPDGRKLRPIAVLRTASLRSIKAMARGRPSPYSQPVTLLKRMVNVVCALHVSLPSSTSAMVLWLSRKMKTRNGGDAAVTHPCTSLPLPPPPPPSSASPHKAALQRAFRCLVSGVEERRLASGLPRLSNLSHQDEYAELRSFCEDVRRRSTAPEDTRGNLVNQEASSSPRVCLVRSDASRCYDSLPQPRVLQEALSLIAHDAYRSLVFTDVYAAPPRSSTLATAPVLQAASVKRTVPLEELASGNIAAIPRGHIYWEEEGKDAKSGAGASAADVDGNAARALLREHLQRHLVVLRGTLYEQHTGIVQGSPVAMLLCDQLFCASVDTQLSAILSEHAERSLLLRRVDDVLVATTSAVAAQRCWSAMADGWPSVGYFSNPAKLTLASSEGRRVPWCGLLLHDTTLEVSVQWQRMAPLLTSLLVSDTRRSPIGDSAPLLFTQRIMAVVHLRVPPTALCCRMNSTARQLQTFYEAALIWSRLVLRQVQDTLPVAHHRCVAVLLLRPLAACVARLHRLLRRHSAFLQARQSSCSVTPAEVRVCVLSALHRTLQARLRLLVLAAAEMRGVRQRKPGRCGVQSERSGLTRETRRSCKGVVQLQKQTELSLRSFWWCAAAEVERQWRGALAALEENSSPSTVKAESRAEAARLLRDSTSSSLHARALKATQLLFGCGDREGKLE